MTNSLNILVFYALFGIGLYVTLKFLWRLIFILWGRFQAWKVNQISNPVEQNKQLISLTKKVQSRYGFAAEFSKRIKLDFLYRYFNRKVENLDALVNVLERNLEVLEKYSDSSSSSRNFSSNKLDGNDGRHILSSAILTGKDDTIH